jgi:hypothetical protein
MQLVYEIAKRSKTGESSYGHKAIKFMWKFAFPKEQIDKVLVN